MKRKILKLSKSTQEAYELRDLLEGILDQSHIDTLNNLIDSAFEVTSDYLLMSDNED